MQWVYISMVYVDGPYGENAAKQMNLKAKNYGVCIEVSEMYVQKQEDEEGQRAMDDIVKKLIRYQTARVVVVFLLGETNSNIFLSALRSHNVEEKFIILASDSAYFELYGLFGVQPQRGVNESFFNLLSEYANDQDPKTQVEDSLLREYHADKYNCSWDKTSVLKTGCDERDSFVFNMPAVRKSVNFHNEYLRMHDIVFLYAEALQKALGRQCAHIDRNDKKGLRSCLRGYYVIRNLRYTQFGGAYNIAIDGNGDAYARWYMYQFQRTEGENVEKVTIGTYDELSEPKIHLFLDKIDWSMYSNFSQQNVVVQGDNVSIPESVCSHPCKPREYYIQQELPCCWECRTCGPSEYIVNEVKCVPCPFGFWPDEETATKCVAIDKTHLKLDSWVTLILLIAATVGAVSTLGMTVFYINKRDVKIIKATTRELCFLILFGILLAFVATIFFILKPNYWFCLANRHGFNVSVAIIYAPLLIKTIRIFRIFRATNTGMKHMDVKSQLLLCALLILIQVSLSLEDHIERIVNNLIEKVYV